MTTIPLPPVSRVGILAKSNLHAATTHLVEISEWLSGRDVTAVFETETAALLTPSSSRVVLDKPTLARSVDMVLVLGGDGTLLAMADCIGEAESDIPILGVNFGSLGFLTEVTLPELYRSLETALTGRAVVEERLMLRSTTTRQGTTFAEAISLNGERVGPCGWSSRPRGATSRPCAPSSNGAKSSVLGGLATALLEVLNLKTLHVAVVLFERPHELVGAVVAAHEIQELGLGGVGSGLERRLAWSGNGPRRQPRVAVGVVRRIEQQIVASQVAVEPSRPLQRIDHGRVALESHVLLEAVRVDGRDEGPLVGTGRLLLHQRRQRDELADGEPPRAGCPSHLGREGVLEPCEHRRRE